MPKNSLQPKTLFTSGLQAGFAGESNMSKITRGSFRMTSSHLESDGGTYHDEWMSGGGQELIRTPEGKAYTRTYVGNTISDENLSELGISEKAVMTFLKGIITEHGEHIRLDGDLETEDGDWRYSYTTTYKREDPFIINGIEEIYYKGESVFVHTFGISEIKES